MRNHVEGKFGQGNNGYELNRIRASRQDTSESWISAILFVMNLTKLMRVAGKYVCFLARILRGYTLEITRSVDANYWRPGLRMKLAFT